MALMNCGECGARVSSAAGSCTQCGAPAELFRERHSSVHPVAAALGWIVAGCVLTIGALLMWSGKQTEQTTTAAPIVLPDGDESVSAAREALRSSGNFVERRGQEYGYQLLADPKGKLSYFRYLGTSKQTTRFAEVTAGRVTTFTCQLMCDEVVATVTINGQPAGSQRMTVEGGTLLYAVIEDIVQGRLTVYRPPKN